MVEAEEDYVTFNILKYPFSIIVIATAISVVYYLKIGLLKKGDIKTIAKTTVNKIKSTEITLLLLLCTASIMMDSGMTTILSEAIVELAGRGYAFMSSVIGVLGAFITGSNTNANILFGSLQETAAISLGMAPAIICAVQSVSASVGGAIGPTTTALVAAAAEKSGKEAEIYRHTLAPTVITAAVLGALALLAV
ncbi:MAG: L-lactate permease [Anaerovoracaceae bacterium]